VFPLFVSLLFSAPACLRTRTALQAEIIALRHQLLVLQRSNNGHRVRLRAAERLSGLGLQVTDEPAMRFDYRQARGRHCPVSPGIPVVLEVEEPPSYRFVVLQNLTLCEINDL
jgi:hypothetical protein